MYDEVDAVEDDVVDDVDDVEGGRSRQWHTDAAGCRHAWDSVVCVAGSHRDALRRGRRRRRASGGESGDPHMDSLSRNPLVCIRQVAEGGTENTTIFRP